MGNGSNWRLCDKSSLKFINHVEGYLEPNGAGNYKYVYQYKDIWGNTRVTYADDNNNGVASPGNGSNWRLCDKSSLKYCKSRSYQQGTGAVRRGTRAISDFVTSSYPKK